MENRETRVLSFLDSVIEAGSLNEKESPVIQKCADEIRNGTDINRALLAMKTALSALSVKHELSGNGLNCLSEISRLEPSTSVSSMWNFMMKKTKD